MVGLAFACALGQDSAIGKIAGLFGDAALEAREKFVELGVKSSKVVRS